MSVQDTLLRRHHLLDVRRVVSRDEGLVSCHPRALQLHRRHRRTQRKLVALVAMIVQYTLPRRQHLLGLCGVA